MKRRRVRLNRYVALAAGTSRRGADDLIAAGRIQINGQTATLGSPVADGDTVTFNGETLTVPLSFRYVAVNKPVDYVSSRRRQAGERIVYDLLPPDLHALRLAGRLDRESSGLILLSDDGDFIQRVSHPSADKLKLYEVDLSHELTQIDRTKLEAGIRLADGASRLMIRRSKGKTVTLALAEGRNRQIRRTFGALGYSVKRLHRTAIGDYLLGDLAPGQWREFSL